MQISRARYRAGHASHEAVYQTCALLVCELLNEKARREKSQQGRGGRWQQGRQGRCVVLARVRCLCPVCSGGGRNSCRPAAPPPPPHGGQAIEFVAERIELAGDGACRHRADMTQKEEREHSCLTPSMRGTLFVRASRGSLPVVYQVLCYHTSLVLVARYSRSRSGGYP